MSNDYEMMAVMHSLKKFDCVTEDMNPATAAAEVREHCNKLADRVEDLQNELAQAQQRVREYCAVAVEAFIKRDQACEMNTHAGLRSAYQRASEEARQQREGWKEAFDLAARYQNENDALRAQVEALREVYEAARRVLRYNGIDRNRTEGAVEELKDAIEHIKQMDGMDEWAAPAAEAQSYIAAPKSLAARIANAVYEDEQAGGCDISAGLFGPCFSRLVAELGEAQGVPERWRDAQVELPEHSVPVIGYNPAWIDEDFNPEGIRECFRSGDGADWHSAFWFDHQDCYEDAMEAPTRWQPYPAAPAKEKNNGHD